MASLDFSDPKKLRERAGFSQADLAIHLDIDQSQVSRIEKNPKSASWGIVEQWYDICGQARIQSRKNLFDNFRDRYRDIFKKAGIIRAYLIEPPLEMDIEFLPEFDKEAVFPTLEDILDNFEKSIRKAKVVMVGPFDVGKSFILNLMLGGDFLPSRLSPTTSNVVFIKHLSDRPQGLKSTCYLLRHDFKPERWRDAEYIKNHTSLEGEISLLQEYGQHDARRDRSSSQFNRASERNLGRMVTKSLEHNKNDQHESYYALVFIDAPLLKLCELIDTPGLAHDAIDSEIALKVAQDKPDVIIYCSSMTGFMDSTASYSAMQELIPALKPIPRELPKSIADKHLSPLRNLLILGTKASIDMPETGVEYALDSACYRLTSHLIKAIRQHMRSIGVLSVDSPEDVKVLRERTMPFYIDVDGIPTNEYMLKREELPIADIKELIGEIMPAIIEQNIQDAIVELKSSSIASYKRLGTIIKARIDSFSHIQQELSDREQREPKRKQMMEELIKYASNQIQQQRSECDLIIDNEVKRWTEASQIITFLKQEYSEDSRSEAENGAIALITKRAMTNVSSDMQNRVAKIVEYVRTEVETIDEFSEPDVSFSQKVADSLGLTRGAFIGGAAATGLAVAVTAIPITWPVVILGMGIGAIYKLVVGFFTTWQDRLGKKIAKVLHDNDFHHVLFMSARDYWDRVEDNIIIAIEKADESQVSKMQRLRELVHDTEKSAKRLDEQFNSCGVILDFLEEMPSKVIE